MESEGIKERRKKIKCGNCVYACVRL